MKNSMYTEIVNGISDIISEFKHEKNGSITHNKIRYQIDRYLERIKNDLQLSEIETQYNNKMELAPPEATPSINIKFYLRKKPHVFWLVFRESGETELIEVTDDNLCTVLMQRLKLAEAVKENMKIPVIFNYPIGGYSRNKAHENIARKTDYLQVRFEGTQFLPIVNPTEELESVQPLYTEETIAEFAKHMPELLQIINDEKDD